MQRLPMTQSGYDKILSELKQLKGPARIQVANEIEIARGHGDLRENADYEAAKEKQGMIEAHIRDLEDKIARAEVIDVSRLSGTKVLFGATVTLLNVETDKEMTVTIMGEVEADIDAGIISISSPIARALIGRSLDDEVEVKTPGGVRTYEITDVTFG